VDEQIRPGKSAKRRYRCCRLTRRRSPGSYLKGNVLVNLDFPALTRKEHISHRASSLGFGARRYRSGCSYARDYLSTWF
jgi:hypothetical protein